MAEQAAGGTCAVGVATLTEPNRRGRNAIPAVATATANFTIRFRLSTPQTDGDPLPLSNKLLLRSVVPNYDSLCNRTNDE